MHCKRDIFPLCLIFVDSFSCRFVINFRSKKVTHLSVRSWILLFHAFIVFSQRLIKAVEQRQELRFWNSLFFVDFSFESIALELSWRSTSNSFYFFCSLMNRLMGRPFFFCDFWCANEQTNKYGCQFVEALGVSLKQDENKFVWCSSSILHRQKWRKSLNWSDSDNTRKSFFFISFVRFRFRQIDRWHVLIPLNRRMKISHCDFEFVLDSIYLLFFFSPQNARDEVKTWCSLMRKLTMKSTHTRKRILCNILTSKWIQFDRHFFLFCRTAFRLRLFRSSLIQFIYFFFCWNCVFVTFISSSISSSFVSIVGSWQTNLLPNSEHWRRNDSVG